MTGLEEVLRNSLKHGYRFDVSEATLISGEKGYAIECVSPRATGVASTASEAFEKVIIQLAKERFR